MESMLESATNDNAASELVEIFSRCVEAGLQTDASFAERERRALELSNELARRHLEAALQELATSEGSAVLVDGVEYRRHQMGRGSYHSLCGTLTVERWTYRCAGVRNGPTCVPLELRAGLVERATPQLAFAVTQGYAKQPIRSVEQDLRAAFRCPPSRSTLERMASRIGQETRKVLVRLEGRVRVAEELPAAAAGISLGLDRTTIPMAEEAGNDVAPPRRRKPPQRRTPPRRCLRYRMAYVGTVCITDAMGEPLVTRRYASPAHAGATTVLRRMMSDLRHALASNADLKIGVVQDKAPELWHLIREALRSELKVPGRGWGIRTWTRNPWREVVDWYHLMQHLAAGLEVVVSDENERRRMLTQWQQDLLRDDRAISRIFRWFWDAAEHRSNDVNNKVWRAVGAYILNSRHFHYATMRKLGLPISSGVTEGACKSLIAKRTKRSGQRWRPRGISAVLALRSLLESERLEPFWDLFAQRYVKTLVAA
jgi:hypothetical protein